MLRVELAELIGVDTRVELSGEIDALPSRSNEATLTPSHENVGG
jgi:hypothetical protein